MVWLTPSRRTTWENPETTSTSPPSSGSGAAHASDFALGDVVARVRFSHRDAGSFAPASTTDSQRLDFVGHPWSWLRQVHGAGVRVVTHPGDWAGHEGDALVTSSIGCALAVQVADCAPVVLIAPRAIGVVHAGWRGLAAGVVEAAFRALEEVGSGEVFALVGPHIGPECYEFGVEELEDLVARFGPSVRGRTASGAAAFDVGAAVSAELGRLGVSQMSEVGECTSCRGDRYYSHRARAEPGRHAMVAWMESAS